MWGCLFGDFPHSPTTCFTQFPFPPLFSHIFISLLWFWLPFQTELWCGGGVAFGRGVGGVEWCPCGAGASDVLPDCPSATPGNCPEPAGLSLGSLRSRGRVLLRESCSLWVPGGRIQGGIRAGLCQVLPQVLLAGRAGPKGLG